MFNYGLENDVYDGRRSWGNVKIGDMVAISNLIKALRFQFNKKVQLLTNSNHVNTKNNSETFKLIKYLDNYFKFEDDIQLDEPPYSGNIWVYYNYIIDCLDIRCELENKYLDFVNTDKAVINPILSAKYNEDRNWDESLIEKLIRYCKDYEFEDIVITGTSEDFKHIKLNVGDTNIRFVLDDLDETIKEISTSYIYFGGDSGPTHIASSIDKWPKKIVALYGSNSVERHNVAVDCEFICLEQKKIKLPNKNTIPKLDYSPKPLKNKQLFYKLLNENFDSKLKDFMCVGDNKLYIPEYSRKEYFNPLMKYINESKINNVLEIGMTRKRKCGPDGCSTLLFSYLANQNNFTFTSIDINPANKQITQQLLKEHNLYSDNIYLVIEDVFEYCKYINKIDVLYLDAWDWPKHDEKRQKVSEDNHLEIFKLLEKYNKLNDKVDVVLDDIHDAKNYTGKGAKLIPYLLDNGFKIINSGYQVWLRKE